jgi:hypothetical protein
VKHSQPAPVAAPRLVRLPGVTLPGVTLLGIALLGIALLGIALVGVAGCGTSSELVNYTVTTHSRLVCCRSMHFTVTGFTGARAISDDARDDARGVEVRFASERISGSCALGATAPLVIANHSDTDAYIPTSHELEGSRIKLYPWRLHHDSAHGAIRLARQIQYGDMFEHGNDARLQLMRLPAHSEVALTAVVPGQWLCTKPTELYEGYLDAELDPAFYSQRSRGLRTSPYEQSKDLVSPIGMRYDVVWLSLAYLDALPVVARKESPRGDTISVEIDVKEEPAEFFNAAQRVASSNVIEMVIEQ